METFNKIIIGICVIVYIVCFCMGMYAEASCLMGLACFNYISIIKDKIDKK